MHVLGGKASSALTPDDEFRYAPPRLKRFFLTMPRGNFQTMSVSNHTFRFGEYVGAKG
jgi:hypothetical protein